MAILTKRTHAGEAHLDPPRTLPEEFNPSLDRASNIFRALGDVPRLRLLFLLRHGPLCVSDLARSENQEISTISQRLRVLRGQNLVKRTRQGKHILYALSDQHVTDLIVNALDHVTEGARPISPKVQGAAG